MAMKRKKYCDECNHLHLLDNYCHVYVEENSAYDVSEDYLDEDEDGESGGGKRGELAIYCKLYRLIFGNSKINNIGLVFT